MTLRRNEDGEWVMTRGISVPDMAHEIIEAIGWQDYDLPPTTPTRDLTIARQYVKVTAPKGTAPCRPIRHPTSS